MTAEKRQPSQSAYDAAFIAMAVGVVIVITFFLLSVTAKVMW